MTPEQLESIKARNEMTMDMTEKNFLGLVEDAMQDAWNDICSDTGCYPDDIQKQGQKLVFSPHTWARGTAMLLYARLTAALEEAEKRGYDAAKEQAASRIDNLAAHLNLEQFLLTLRDKPKAAEIGQSVIAILESAAAAIRAMVKP